MHKIEIGQRLAQLRKDVRITRKVLSQITNISADTIRAWETGRTTIRSYNLEQYLNEFKKLGCSATMEWVLNGGPISVPIPRENPQITHNIPSKPKLGITDVESMIDILSLTSNLFYYLDNQERIRYINSDLLFLLGAVTHIHPQMLDNMPFKNVCSETIYHLYHEPLKLCKQGKIQELRYNLGSSYSKTPHMVEMLCCPVIETGSNKIIGILGFASNQKTVSP